MSLCPSILPRETTQVGRISFNLTFEYFKKTVEKIQDSLKSDKNNRYCT
jgi:hypothetical protein